MAYDIGPKIGIDGEAEFRRELQNINTGIKTLGTEMKAVTSAFAGQEKSVESLTAENDVLERTILSLNERLELQKKMLEESAHAYGEADARTQKWQQAVNSTTAELNKARSQMRSNTEAMEQLGQETEETGEALEEAGKEGLSFGDILKANVLSDVVMSGIKALGSAVKGLVGDLMDAAKAADDINTLSVQTGLATDEIQRLQYAAELIDVPMDALTGSLTKLTRNMESAKSGTGSAAEAFKELGVEVTDQYGYLRSNQDVFEEVIEALGRMQNETQRDAYAMSIFGKSAQELNPLIEAGADQLKALGDEAEAAGLILSQESLDGLNRVNDAMDRLNATSEALKNAFMANLAEPVAGFIDEAREMALSLRDLLTGEKSWADFKDEAMEVFHGWMDNIRAWIRDELPGVIANIPKALYELIKLLLEMVPDFWATSIEILGAIGRGLLDGLPDLVASIPLIIGRIFEALYNTVNEVFGDGTIGELIIDGIWSDFTKAAAWLEQKVRDFVDWIKSLFTDASGFDVHSPSRWSEDVFENVMKGAGRGLEAGRADFARSASRAIAKMKMNLSAPVQSPQFIAAGLAGELADILSSTQSGVGGGASFDVTLTLDGAVLARNQYRYNQAEGFRHGSPAVT